jgi:hypothetical protein
VQRERKKKKKQFQYFPRITLLLRDFPAGRGTPEVNIAEISHGKVGDPRSFLSQRERRSGDNKRRPSDSASFRPADSSTKGFLNARKYRGPS